MGTERNRRYQWARRVGLVTATAVTLIGGLHLPIVRGRVLQYACEQLEQQSGWVVAAGALDYNLFSGWVKLSAISVGTLAGQQPLLNAKSLEANLAVTSLITGRLVVESGTLEAPEVYVEVDELGRWNLPLGGQSTSASAGSATAVEVLEFNAIDGTFRLRDRSRSVAVDLPAWKLNIRSDGGGHAFSFETEAPGELGVAQTRASVERIATNGTLGHAGEVHIESLELAIDGARLSASGTLDQQGSLDGRARLELDAAAAARLADPEILIAGTIVSQIRAVGPLDQIGVEVNVEATEIRFAEFDQIEIRAVATHTVGSSEIAVSNLDVKSPAGAVSGQGKWDLGGGESEFRGNLSALDLARVGRALDTPVEAAARASGNVSLIWLGSESKLKSADASIRVSTAASAPRKNVIPLAANLDVRVRGAVANVNVAQLRALGSEWNGNISLADWSRLGGQLRGTVETLADVQTNLAAFLGSESEDPTADGNANIELDLGGTLDLPTVALAAQFQELSGGGIGGAEAELSGMFEAERLAVHNAELRWNGQAATATGALDFSGEEAEADVQFEVGGVDLETLLPAAGFDVPVGGVMSASGAVQGHLSSPRGQLILHGNDVTVFGQKLGLLEANAVAADGAFELQRFHLDQSAALPDGGEFEMSGRFDPRDRSYSMDGKAAGIRIDALEAMEQSTLSAALDLSFQGTGTLDQPVVNAEANVRDAVWNGNSLGDGSIAANVAENIAHVIAQASKYDLKADLSSALAEPYASQLGIVIDSADVSEWGVESVSGKLRAQINARGDLADWQSGVAEAVITNTELQYGKVSVRIGDELKARYQNRTIEFEPAAIDVGKSHIEFAGALPLDDGSTASAIDFSGSLDLGELVALVPSDDPIAASGTAKIDGTVRGSIATPSPSFQATLQNAAFLPSLSISPITAVSGIVRADKDQIELEAIRGEWAGAAVALRGEVPVALIMQAEDETQASAPYRLEWSADNIILESFWALPKIIGGEVGLHGVLEGTSVDPATISGEVEFNQLNLRYGSVEMRQAEPSRFVVRGGRVNVERFALQGPETDVRLSGGVALAPELSLDLQLAGRVSAGVLALPAADFAASGPTTLDLRISGSPANPEMLGAVRWENGILALKNGDFRASNLNVDLKIEPGSVVVDRFDGSLNGGRVSVEGGFKYSVEGVDQIDLRAKAERVYAEIPEGLRTVSNAEITLKSNDDGMVVGGEIVITEGIYRKAMQLDVLLLEAIRNQAAAGIIAGPDPFLAGIDFNIGVTSEDPIVVDNNVAKLEASLDLRLRGSYYQPGLTGQIELEEGGELRVSENRYFIDRGVVNFLSESRIQPSFDIVGRTQVQNKYDVELNVTGGAGSEVETRLSSPSHPELAEPDIISLLLTGRMRDELSGSEVNVAMEQSLSYLTGRVGGRLSSAAEKSLGLSEVRIDPNLISAESDPGARLTVGQNLTSDLQLVYSSNLTDSSDQIWTARLYVTNRLTARGVRESNGEYRFDFQHDLRFGGGPESGRLKKSKGPGRTIGSVEVNGETPLTEAQALARLKIRTGNRYDFFKIREGTDRLERTLHDLNHLEARSEVTRAESDDTTNLKIDIDAGPIVTFVYEGWSPSGGVRKNVRSIWNEGAFDEQRLQDVQTAVRLDLIHNGYLEADVRCEVGQAQTQEKQVVVKSDPGTRYQVRQVEFPGSAMISAAEIQRVLSAADAYDSLYIRPVEATKLIRETYLSRGFIDAEISEPTLEIDSSRRSGGLVVKVNEGPQYRVSRLELLGNSALSETELREAANLRPDAEYGSALLQDLYLRLEERYWQSGFQDAAIEFQMEKASGSPTVVIQARINENRKSVLKDIQVAGNRAVSEKLARRQLGLAEGETLDYKKASEGRKALYSTGAFSLVDLNYVPLPDPGDLTTKPLRAELKLREVQPYRVRYGGFFDTERGPGAIVDLRNYNTLGSARNAGARLRYDSELKEARGFFSQPLLKSFPLESIATIFTSRENQPTFITDRTGFSLVQETRWRDRYVLNYGYRFERTHSFEPEPDPIFPFDVRLNVAPLTVSFLRETRNDIFDATRGSFFAHALEWAPVGLGSDLNFVRYFGQFFKYVPLGRRRELPYQRGVRRSRFVYASGVRLGLAYGLGGQVIPPSERFMGGGGTTIRGFRQDALGPLNFLGEHAGGDAIFILNNELRFPLKSIFDGVAFVDIGNVYATTDEFTLRDLRKTGGFGLRVRTPYFMLRGDYGIKLDRRTGESRGQFFFSIGQAF